ncbi:unnamed protein product [Pieris macdunnoughi]|uniref:Uncharacterized protein n=1 Tax=Pieris macdunnoughi TaxID=345717 RepID=A0A821WPT9_9NEOP|nr:unnamed protein product [Pieris macdunnoughi]
MFEQANAFRCPHLQHLALWHSRPPDTRLPARSSYARVPPPDNPTPPTRVEPRRSSIPPYQELYARPSAVLNQQAANNHTASRGCARTGRFPP